MGDGMVENFARPRASPPLRNASLGHVPELRRRAGTALLHMYR